MPASNRVSAPCRFAGRVTGPATRRVSWPVAQAGVGHGAADGCVRRSQACIQVASPA